LETALSARETIDLDRWSSYLFFFVFARVVEQTAEVVFRTLLTWYGTLPAVFSLGPEDLLPLSIVAPILRDIGR
jgi:hypothetical protein